MSTPRSKDNPEETRHPSMFNAFSFALRKLACAWKRPVSPDLWVMNLDVATHTRPLSPYLITRRQDLLTRYPLDQITAPSWSWVRLESLYQLDQLDPCRQALPPLEVEHCHWVDVGSKNGALLPACWAVAKTLSQSVRVTGVEVDPYRHYLDGYTRGDYAQGLVQQIQAQFQQDLHFVDADICDFAKHAPATAHVVSCFLPFVLAHEHHAWGLPKTLFNPLKVLDALWALLKPQGFLILTNLSENEVAVQARLIQTLADSLAQKGQGLRIILEALPHPSQFMKLEEERRYLWMLQKIDPSPPCV